MKRFKRTHPNGRRLNQLVLTGFAAAGLWAWSPVAWLPEASAADVQMVKKALAVDDRPDIEDTRFWVRWTLVNRLSFENFKSVIFDLQALGTRYWDRPGNDIAVQYIFDKLESFGYDNVTLDPYLFEGIVRHNIYATKVGSVFPDQMYIIGAHMDSININEDFDNAPGADDDASGTSSVLEIARVFANVRTDYSVRFCLWNNEETGLDGSEAYVATHRDLQGTPGEPFWLGMIQQDMIMFDHGPPPFDDPTYVPDADVEFNMHHDFDDAAEELAELVAGAMGRYNTGTPAEVGDNMNFTDSKSFWDDCPAVSVRENKRVDEIGNGWNPHWHQPTDRWETFTEQDFRFGFALCKMVCGATGELSGAILVADGSMNGTVDMDDLTHFWDCFGQGETGPVSSRCAVFDSEPDGDVDHDDLRYLREAISAWPKETNRK